MVFVDHKSRMLVKSLWITAARTAAARGPSQGQGPLGVPFPMRAPVTAHGRLRLLLPSLSPPMRVGLRGRRFVRRPRQWPARQRWRGRVLPPQPLDQHSAPARAVCNKLLRALCAAPERGRSSSRPQSRPPSSASASCREPRSAVSALGSELCRGRALNTRSVLQPRRAGLGPSLSHLLH